MLVRRLLGYEQPEDEVHGLVIGRVEVHAFAELQESREGAAEAGHAGMGQGAAFSEPRRAETLALDQPIEDGLCAESRVGVGENLSQRLQGTLPAPRRHVAAYAPGIEDLIEGYHPVPLPGRGRIVAGHPCGAMRLA